MIGTPAARFDSILFDFDGVLADTEPLHCSCWAEVLRPEGIELDWDTYVKCGLGLADVEMLTFLCARAAVPRDVTTLLAHFEQKKALFRARTLETNPCLPQTVALMRSLSAFRLAVVTSSEREEVEPLLELSGIRPHLEAAVFGGDVERLKPAPDPYLLVAKRLGALRPLAVEDSAAGVASARAAGFDVIQVASAAEVPAAVRARLGL